MIEDIVQIHAGNEHIDLLVEPLDDGRLDIPQEVLAHVAALCHRSAGNINVEATKMDVELRLHEHFDHRLLVFGQISPRMFDQLYLPVDGSGGGRADDLTQLSKDVLSLVLEAKQFIIQSTQVVIWLRLQRKRDSWRRGFGLKLSERDLRPH